MQESPHTPASPQAVLPSLGAPREVQLIDSYAVTAVCVWRLSI